MNHTLKSITLAAAATLAVTAHAGEKEMLDLLVKKGTITAEERGKLLEESKAKASSSGVDRVFPKEDATKRLTISGYFQTQYENFSYDDDTATSWNTQSSFVMRRLYLEFLADVGEGISANIVTDLSQNTARNIDRAMVSISKPWGTVDVGYRKVTWGYEESTLSSLFKASSSKLLAVERGITNRYWNEQQSSGGRLGFGAHHTGVFYTSPANPQGLEYGFAVVNAAQGLNNFKGQNDVGAYANLVFNWKASDSERYAVGVNYGHTKYSTYTESTNAAVATGQTISGYNPFVQAQLADWTLNLEYLATKLETATPVTPTGYNACVAYKVNDNWEAVARYTALDTDGRGQAIKDGVRDFNATTGSTAYSYDKSNAVYLGLNYYFSLSAAGSPVHGPNAKVQLGYEVATFSDPINSALNTPVTGPAGVVPGHDATVNTIRAQFQVAF